MPTSVRFDPKTEAVLRRLARRTGRTKSDVLREAIARMAEPEDLEPSGSFLAMVADLVGVTRRGPEDHARRSEELFRTRLRAGRRQSR
jgi:predicted DNA-binding protein